MSSTLPGLLREIQNTRDEPLRCLRVHSSFQYAQRIAYRAHSSQPLLLFVGLELIKDLRAMQPDLPVLAISMHDESLYAERVLRAGARGCVMKHEGGDEIIRAIRCVLSGNLYVSERMSARILEAVSGRQPATQCSVIKQLSDRELEVFKLIGQGLSTQQIAGKLHLSAKTVDAHRASIKDELEIKSVNELIPTPLAGRCKRAPMP